MITVGTLIELLSKFEKTNQLVICMSGPCPMEPVYEIQTSTADAIYLRTNELNQIAIYGYANHPSVVVNPIKAANAKKQSKLHPSMIAANEAATIR